MSVNFDRDFEVQFGVSGRPGYSIAPRNGVTPKVVFNIEKAATQSPNTSKLSLYNLDPTQVATLHLKDCAVAIAAGYIGNVGQIFGGTVTHAVTKRDGGDEVTELELTEGRVSLRDSQMSLSYSGAISRETLIKTVASNMGLSVVIGPDVKFGKYSLGYSFIGKGQDALRKLCAADGNSWTIQTGGVLQITKSNNPVTNRVYVLSAETGLISIPEKVCKGARGRDKKKHNESTATNQEGHQVVYFINPAIGINDYVYVEAKYLKGFYRVNKITLSGDSLGDSWECKAELLEVKK